MKWFLIIFWFTLGLSLSACSVSVGDSSIISPSTEIDQLNLESLLTSYEEVEMLSVEGSRLYALQKISGTSGITIVVFHGNALNLTLQPWFGLLEALADLEVNILAIDYRGFGSSPGVASLSNMREDALSAIESLPDNQTVYLYGLSLGSVLAADLASRDEVQGIIIEGGVTNQSAMIEWFQTKNALGSFVKVDLDPRIVFDVPAAMAEAGKPVLVIHGENDTNIPVRMGRDIFGASEHPQSDLYLVESGGHCDSFAVDDNFLARIRSFLSTTQR